MNMRAPAVVFVTETFPPEVNGVARSIRRIVAGLVELGWTVTVVRPRQGRTDSGAALKAWNEIRVPSIPLPGYAGLRIGLPRERQLRRQWEADRPDWIHVVTEGPLGWSAVTAANRMGIPVSSSFHTNFHTYMAYYSASWIRNVASAYLRRFHNRTVRTFAPTPQMCSQLEVMGVSRLGVLGRGVDAVQFNPNHRSQALRREWGIGNDDCLVAIYVGRLAAEKNLPLVLDAFAAMRRVRPGSKLVLVGDGPLRAALQSAHPEQVFAGSLEGVDLSSHYASADVMLFPSLTETFGNVVTEGMASGLAVLAFDYAAANLHIRAGTNGISVPFAREALFTGAAQRLAESGLPAIHRLGTEARRTALGLSWDAVLNRFDRYLRHAGSVAAEQGIAAARCVPAESELDRSTVEPFGRAAISPTVIP